MSVICGFGVPIAGLIGLRQYDYLFDYTFQLDGSFEIRLSASGYVQGGVWDEEQKSYGHRLRETSMASLHDHVINYKIDFDVAGPANSLMAVALEMEDVEQPWFDDEDWGSVVHQQKLVRRFIDSEDRSRLDYARNGEGVYVVVNKNETNAWGSLRGVSFVHCFRTVHTLTGFLEVCPASGQLACSFDQPQRQTGERPLPPCCARAILTSSDERAQTEKNVEWAKQHLSVTKRQETERDSSSSWNMNRKPYESWCAVYLTAAQDSL